jgi:DNA polymerase-3 subunit delta'
MDKEVLNLPKIGNEKAIEFLSRVLTGANPASAYLFLGPSDLGKSTIALSFARALMAGGNSAQAGFNSDLHILEPLEGKQSISINQVRDLIKTLNLSSFLDSYQIGIIKEAELLSQEAQSALLKTLEEPQEKVIIILLAASDDSLLPTILSRVQKLYFQAVPTSTIYDYLLTLAPGQRSLAKDLAHLSLGRPLQAIRLLENPNLYQAYLDKAKIILQLFSLSTSARLLALDSLMTDRSYSPAAIKAATDLINILEGLLRDILLLHFNQPERVQHLALKPDLEEKYRQMSGTLNDEALLTWLLERFKLSAQAQEYLAASVNPRLVLEQLAINLL